MLMAADATMAALLFWVVGLFRFGDADWETLWHAFNVDATQGAMFYAVAWVVLLWSLGLYALRVRWTVAGELNDILVASFMLAFGTMTFLYLVKLDVSRLFLLILLVAQPVVTILSRLALRAFFNWLRAHGYNRCYMLVIGVGAEAQAFADAVERHRDLGIEVIGHLREPDATDPVVTRPILGDGEELQRLFHERVVDEVAICVGPEAADWSKPIIRLAADEGKHVRVPMRIAARTFEFQTEELDGLLVRSYVNGPTRMLSLAAEATHGPGRIRRWAGRAEPVGPRGRDRDPRPRGPADPCSTRHAWACTAGRSRCSSSGRWCGTPRRTWQRSDTSNERSGIAFKAAQRSTGHPAGSPPARRRASTSCPSCGTS